MAYEEKKKVLFDCLLTAEKSIVGTSLEQKDSRTGHSPQRTGSKVVGRRFQGRESIFKRPAAPISKCLKPRRAPDYQVRSFLNNNICVFMFICWPKCVSLSTNSSICRWIHTNGKSIHCQMQTYRTERIHRRHLRFSKKSRNAKICWRVSKTTKWMEKLHSNERAQLKRRNFKDPLHYEMPSNRPNQKMMMSMLGQFWKVPKCWCQNTWLAKRVKIKSERPLRPRQVEKWQLNAKIRSNYNIWWRKRMMKQNKYIFSHNQSFHIVYTIIFYLVYLGLREWLIIIIIGKTHSLTSKVFLCCSNAWLRIERNRSPLATPLLNCLLKRRHLIDTYRQRTRHVTLNSRFCGLAYTLSQTDRHTRSVVSVKVIPFALNRYVSTVKEAKSHLGWNKFCSENNQIIIIKCKCNSFHMRYMKTEFPRSQAFCENIEFILVSTFFVFPIMNQTKKIIIILTQQMAAID